MRCSVGKSTNLGGFRRFASRSEEGLQKAKKAFQWEDLKTKNHLSLPRLPIPTLKGTAKRYSRAIEGLYQDEGFRNHFLKLDKNQDVDEYIDEHLYAVHLFAEGPGKKVQEILETKDATWEKNGEYPFFFFEKEWDDMYLKLRCSNPVNVNPGYILNPIQGTQARRTACIVYAAAHWLLRARGGNFREERFPMCISQISTLYGAARIPQKGRDLLVPMGNEIPRHVVVQRGGRFFKVDVIDANGEICCVSSIESKLARIVDSVGDDGSETSDVFSDPPSNVGLLTSTDRDEWAHFRAELAKEATNRESLAVIDSALLMIALDTPAGANDDKADALTQSSRNVLHGLSHSRRDRWWDKLQLIAEAHKDSATGFQFEHSHSDGAAWNFWLEDVASDSLVASKVAIASLASSGPESCPSESELRFVVSDVVRAGIEHADALLAGLADNVETEVVSVSGVGRHLFKNLKVSPDAMAQLSYLAAHRQLHGWLPPTYEACSTRQFFHGRTETIRSATIEAEVASRLLMTPSDSETDSEALAEAIRQMAVGHSGVARAAASGDGIDRHLLCLEALANEHLEDAADVAAADAVFKSPLFAASKHFALSTSNVSAPFLRLFTFGPVVPNGYGIGYQVLENSIPINITSWKDDPDTSSEELGRRVEENLHRIVRVLKKNQ
eukprot:g980.t1